ncbi:MAG TPA: aldehyde dehydrogenase family protein [Leptolyngbyaceae cyanobacterium M33_DOE_097]|uniref:Aldehyde dehydrogenase family protein n=1 Tax=Oscillatoriales cyanobacterium SpSt-418 TaxID=2282169 RepID=A0A7C3PFZ6_9CYAN|nr:aldehyde dehydrogenase family protein [Leptolyngbyaceae cyanobacterium M33_DOE_097]
MSGSKSAIARSSQKNSSPYEGSAQLPALPNFFIHHGAVMVKSFVAPPATTLEMADAIAQRLAARKTEWVNVSCSDRINYLQGCVDATLAVAEEWATLACQAKGIDPTAPLAGEEWIVGPAGVLGNLRQLIHALEAGGQPKPVSLTERNGQWIAKVFPDQWLDKVLYSGFVGELWLEPGQPPTQGEIYRQASQTGSLTLVLGAGNISAIAPMDSLHKLFVENSVVLLKLNPVNEYLGAVFEKALKPLCDAGFLEIVYGGAELGRALCQHSLVDQIHVTGSQYTYQAIAQSLPTLKPITAELGCVTPILVVPGNWSDADLVYQARQIAGMVVHNASFNCAAAKVIVTAKGWPQRASFLSYLKQELAQTPLRKAYYPGATQRYQQFVERYSQAESLGTPDPNRPEPELDLPWLWIQDVAPEADAYALNEEAFCGVLAEVSLPVSESADFLQQAVPFVNEQIWGNLSCSILVDPATQKCCQAELDSAIAQLRYGAIAVNVWSAIIFGVPGLTWGAFPGNTPDDIQSGIGVVHNGYLFDHPQKSVLWAPFRLPFTPLWFPRHRTLLQTARSYTRLQAHPNLLNLLPALISSLKG